MALHITHERLLEVLDYNRETGIFTWKKMLARRCPVGKKAGGFDGDGYITIRADWVSYRAHHLAWFYVTRVWPEKQIDHRDLDKSNNRIDNLREATGTQNQANIGIKKSNTSGFKGVSWHADAGKWQSHIKVAGRSRNLGYFLTKEDAHQAYAHAASEHFGEFARTA